MAKQGRKIRKFARLRRENLYQGVDFIGRKIIYLEYMYKGVQAISEGLGKLNFQTHYLMKWRKLFGFREHTSISSSANKAFAYFWLAAELLAKTYGFACFFGLILAWFLAWNDVVFRVLIELRSRNPKLQLVVLVTIVALLSVHISITDTLAWICCPETIHRHENHQISVILTEKYLMVGRALQEAQNLIMCKTLG